MRDSGSTLDSGDRRFNVAFWIAIVLLVAAVVAGAVVFAVANASGGKPVEVILPSEPSCVLEVYLAGAVANEGIYTFGQDSSLQDVLQGAGGVTDGSQPLRVKISVLEAGEDPFVGYQEAEAADEATINVNTASFEELQTLSGIGPVKAEAIIDYRTEHGFFHTVDELIEVSGIGPVTLEAIRDQVRVVD